MKPLPLEKFLEFPPYRRKRAFSLYIQGNVQLEKKAGGGVYFLVRGTEPHQVIYSKNKGWSCDCYHFSLKQTPCAHILSCNILLMKPNKDEAKILTKD